MPHASTSIPHIVCLGGGYNTISVVKTLKGAIKKGKVRVTVIDRNNYHVFHGLVAEMLVGKIQPADIITPHRRLFLPAYVHNAEVESVDFVKKEVVTTRLLDGREYRIAYDHLVIGLGSTDDLSRYPGLAENTFRLKTFWDVFQLRNHILHMMELADIETDREERKRLLTFVIAGGNYAGIEVATELQEYLHALAGKEYAHISKEELRIVLIHSGERILPELGARYQRLTAYAERFLQKLQLDIKLNTRLASATPGAAMTNHGEEIPTRTIISCTGTAQWPLFDRWSFTRDDRGRLKTENTLNIIGETHIWSGGDCAAVPMPKGGDAPPLAIYAITAGKVIGKNILRQLEGKPLKPYRFTGLGDACSLAHRKAVGHLKGIQVTGFPSWLVWRAFMFAYLPAWDRRIRTLVDWLLWPIIGRDVASIQSNQKLGISEKFYEAGQTIIKEGDTGNAMYLIREGTVEVVHEGTPEQLLATLTAGDHFGETAVFQRCRRTATVRAKTPVKLLEIKRDAAEMLKLSLPLVER